MVYFLARGGDVVAVNILLGGGDVCATVGATDVGIVGNRARAFLRLNQLVPPKTI